MAPPNLELCHGYEKQFFTNHMGHFVLVTGLLNRLTPRGRVVMLSSRAHERAPRGGIAFDNLDGSKGYNSRLFYAQSKIASILMAKSLAKQFEGTGKTAFSCHPGVISDTNLFRYLPSYAQWFMDCFGFLLLKTIPEGAATQTYLSTADDLEQHSGRYFVDCNVYPERQDGTDMDTADKLWNICKSIAAGLSKP
ncbi:hypothetical protein SARC_14532 [Sphaeroforma arctica JP610]|uniref:Uncharacterized protein n=1 Tax=Sphaeroforma arctica JP610 TaxID=667725 RepID=A0A0L0F855_9EUKA|nr:hypothetical protein SARC_14532 [Sphaeroforma arctica JP610]KNC72907.1 hypothetical protein SARC_14532 [Sphaeroforma arctica JP610]|eukprot:XP_014146809.1 hypothetical protein SARC_14532 [Sphaeroforma arctica JP610]